MSYHDDWSGRTELPKNTGEFRATPDLSASTAEFKAFARAYDNEPDRPWTADAWPAQPDPGSVGTNARPTWLIIAAVVAIALVITIVLLTVG